MISYKTAIKRNRVSAPIRYLFTNGYLNGFPILDYGCGYGVSADQLGFDKYDPYYFPDPPTRKYPIILCMYVLNVQRSIEDCPAILNSIQTLLTDAGTAYIGVRRDLKKFGKTSRGYQIDVRLNLPTVYKNASFEIYAM